MDIKIILTCLIVEATALCPIGYKYNKDKDICYQTCKDCHLSKIKETRRQFVNVINPSKAEMALIQDKFKYAVKNFVDSEGMIDTYICPSGWRYDFDKKACQEPPPKTRRYIQIQPVDCPYCNLREDQTEKPTRESVEAVDIFEVPKYVARMKKINRRSLAELIHKLMKQYF